MPTQVDIRHFLFGQRTADYVDRHGSFWGAQAASLLVSATCRNNPCRNNLLRIKFRFRGLFARKIFPARRRCLRLSSSSGGKGIRTPDFQLAKLALYQLSYAPARMKDGRWKP